MEAGAIGEIRAELRAMEHRVDAMHNGLGSVRAGIGRAEVNQGVTNTEIKNMRDDIRELNGKMTWILRGLFAAIAVGLTFTVAVATLVLQST